MLHFEPSWVPATCHLGSPISCVKSFVPTHLNNKKLLRCALHCLETRPTKLLGTLKNPNPFSCFVLTFLNHPTPFPPFLERTWAAQTPPDAYFLSLPKPFSSHSCEQWNSQPPFHGSFMGSPNPSPCFILNLPKPSPPWRTIESSVRAIFTSEKPHAIAGYTHTHTQKT